MVIKAVLPFFSPFSCNVHDEHVQSQLRFEFHDHKSDGDRRGLCRAWRIRIRIEMFSGFSHATYNLDIVITIHNAVANNVNVVGSRLAFSK